MADSQDGSIDPDPVVASYDVYIKPNISNSRQIYILQFPNRSSQQHYSASNESQPLKFRVKPQTGMLEIDVPIDAWRNYDKDKGLKWGDAMRKSIKAGQSHGMPGGFGIGGAANGPGRGRPAREESVVISQERLLADYAGAIQREQVLTKQTLGGQTVPNDKASPQYMVGAFRKNELHLTPVSHMVQMRPQFHHIDAHIEQEKLGRPREANQNPRSTEQRPVHQTAKTTQDGEEENSESMAERISAAQGEPWRGHRYIDEDSHEAWSAFDQDLFIHLENGDKDVEMPDVDDLGKSTAAKAQSKDLKDNLPVLISKLDNAQYLDKISAPTDQAKLSRSKKVRDKTKKGKKKTKEAQDGGVIESDSSSTLSDAPSDEETDEEDGEGPAAAAE